MTEREKIIELARECGIYLEIPKQLETFYHAAQKEAFEQAAEVCEETVAAIEGQLCAEAIRQLIKE